MFLVTLKISCVYVKKKFFLFPTTFTQGLSLRNFLWRKGESKKTRKAEAHTFCCCICQKFSPFLVFSDSPWLLSLLWIPLIFNSGTIFILIPINFGNPGYVAGSFHFSKAVITWSSAAWQRGLASSSSNKAWYSSPAKFP